MINNDREGILIIDKIELKANDILKIMYDDTLL